MKNDKVKKELIVTVITPTYNQVEFIEDTIKSVITQTTYSNIEFIIIDGESSDGTDKLVNKYRDTYKIKYVREKDSGQADAINKGLNLASGDIVCWLNSDDMFYDNKVIDGVINAFKEKEALDIVFGNGCFWHIGCLISLRISWQNWIARRVANVRLTALLAILFVILLVLILQFQDLLFLYLTDH